MTDDKRPDQEAVEQAVIRPLVDRMIELGVLPEAPESDYTVTWEDIEALTEAERDDEDHSGDADL